MNLKIRKILNNRDTRNVLSTGLNILIVGSIESKSIIAIKENG